MDALHLMPRVRGLPLAQLAMCLVVWSHSVKLADSRTAQARLIFEGLRREPSIAPLHRTPTFFFSDQVLRKSAAGKARYSAAPQRARRLRASSLSLWREISAQDSPRDASAGCQAAPARRYRPGEVPVRALKSLEKCA